VTGTIKTRVFLRSVEPGNYASAVVEVTAEVNTFLAQFDPINVINVLPHTGPFGKYGESILYQVVVIYLEL